MHYFALAIDEYMTEACRASKCAAVPVQINSDHWKVENATMASILGAMRHRLAPQILLSGAAGAAAFFSYTQLIKVSGNLLVLDHLASLPW